jgi:hypothetical protein
VTSAPRSSLRAGANFRSRAKPAQDLKWRPIPPIAVRLPRLLATAATAARSALDRVWHALVDSLASCYVPWSVGGELGKDVAASDGRGRCWVVSNLHESRHATDQPGADSARICVTGAKPATLNRPSTSLASMLPRRSEDVGLASLAR